MSRIRLVRGILLAALSALPTDGAAQCTRSGDGDICAAGSPWHDFTRLRLEPRDTAMPATTTTVHSPQDFAIALDTDRAKGLHGSIVVLGGMALLMRDVPHEAGYEIDALDGPVLMNQLVLTLLDQGVPRGPGSVTTSRPIRIEEKTRAIAIATSSASGRLEAPWSLTGVVRRRDRRIEYDLRLTARASGRPYAFAAAGFWAKDATLPPLDDHTPLDGWTVHWLGPMTTASAQGTTLDHAAPPASTPWKDVGALRHWIAEEPSRRASRRVPVDAANPGRPESIAYEAVEIGATGARKPRGAGVRDYRPGVDVLAEDTTHQSITKTLTLGHGLSLTTDVYRQGELTGFGLVLVDTGQSCFSWEWFTKAEGGMFDKLRGSGRVKVSVVGTTGEQELAAVEFLDDIALQCHDRSSGVVQEARIKRGSVLRLRP